MISGGKKKGSLKGFSINEALERLKKGELESKGIINFQRGRAEGLIILKDILQNTHIVLKDLGKKTEEIDIYF